MVINNYADLEKYTNISLELFLLLTKEELDSESANSFLNKYSYVVESFLSEIANDKNSLYLSYFGSNNVIEKNDFYRLDIRNQLILLSNYLRQAINSTNVDKINSEYKLKQVFNDYPNIVFITFHMSFSIHTKLYAGIIYELIDNLPKTAYSIKDANVEIVFKDENIFLENLRTIIDFHYLARKWRSYKIYFNGIEINEEIFYCLYTFLGYNKKECLIDRSKAYKKKKTTKTHNKKNSSKLTTINKIDLSTLNNNEILDCVINEYEKIYLKKYAHEIITGNNSDRIIIIENQVIIYFVCDMKRLRSQLSSTPCLTIQELTYNELFKFNFAGFCLKFNIKNLFFDFLKFQHLDSKCFFPDDYEYFNFADEEYPQLELKKRFAQHPGILYHFLVISIVDNNKIEHFGIGYTTKSVNKLFLKICNELLTKNYNSINSDGVNGLITSASLDFLNAFLSLKGVPKIKRLEEMVSYFVIDKHIKTNQEISSTYKKILSDFKTTSNYKYLERGFYKKPQNRWKTEEMVYNIIHSIYGNYQVIYQYKPYFLRTAKGQLSYDIYICGLKIAIEYQGQQHFYPVDYFGGKEHFDSQQKRDELKLKLSKENNVSLIYINYYDDITPDFIKTKIEEALSLRCE